MIGDNDLAPTILELAGKPIPSTVEGTSFVPLLTNPTQPWRKRYFLQYLTDNLGIYDITSYNGVRTSPDDTIAPDSLFRNTQAAKPNLPLQRTRTQRRTCLRLRLGHRR